MCRRERHSERYHGLLSPATKTTTGYKYCVSGCPMCRNCGPVSDELPNEVVRLEHMFLYIRWIKYAVHLSAVLILNEVESRVKRAKIKSKIEIKKSCSFF